MFSNRRLASAAVLLAAPAALFAQDTTARLSGTVTDSTGAAVPNATVSLFNPQTRAVISHVTSDDQGRYTALQLPPGTYRLVVEAAGFQKTETTVELSVAARVEMPIALQVGSAGETVIVTAKAEELNRSDATVSTLISPSDVENLPLPNREITNLLALAPGVVFGRTAGTDVVNSAQLSINGSRTLNTETLLDGNSVVEGVTGQISRLPSPDMLGEFRIITADAPAEYGRTSGGVITLITRSGTSKFHGGIYELFRNAVLNANTLADKLQTPVVKRPANNYNQFGAILSGPIYIPRLYDGKERTFFYLNYDQTLQRVASFQTQSVPSASFRSGDFSTSPVIVYDPLTNRPFPNNQIPQNRIDAAAARFMSIMPLPNTLGTFDNVSNRYTNNYVFQNSVPYVAPRYSGRVDHSVGEKLRLYGSVNRWIANSFAALAFNNPILATSPGCSCDQGWEASTGGTYTVTPTTVVDIRFGFNRWVEERGAPSLGTDPSQTVAIQRYSYHETPNINISSYSTFGATNGSTSQTYSNTYTPYGSVTKVLGQHTIKAGALLRKDEVNVFNTGSSFQGSYSFTGAITDITGSGGKATNGLADFLLGAVKTSSYAIPQPLLGRRNFNVGVYGQDDWRITPTLTANLGVRYDYESPMYIATDRYSRFDNATGQLLVANKNASRTLNITSAKLNFAPRIGLSWSAHPSTVVRAGYGTFYGQIMSNLGGQVSFPGYDVPVSFNNLGTRVAQPFTLSQGMPLTGVQDLNNPQVALASASNSNPFNAGAVSYQSINPLSLNQQWNASVQQSFSGTVVEIGYVGSHAVHLPLYLNANLPAFNQATAVAYANTTVATQNARPFPTLGTLTGSYNVGDSSYNSLQVTARRRFGQAFSLQSSYTWSHTIDDGSGIFNFSQVNGLNAGQYPSDPVLRKTQDRSNSAYDVRHSYTLAAQYRTRGPWFTRNIEISPIFSARTGFPLTITQTNEFPGVNSQRPNGDSSQLKISPYRNGSGIQYFRPTSDPSFPLSPSGPVFIGTGAARKQVVATGLGNVPRYSVRAPGEINFDLSASRSFPLYKEFAFVFRVDAFNVLNHNNLANPGTSLGLTTDATHAFFNAPSFGLITGSTSNRFLQIVTRLNF
ncbi:TonB-dependent receptor [Terriglobus aquaticus]|uniref:TonB-dependent receptor domain-containing protein n=1 Tax=Terriglobus aquaticus TaxID=940139 RepID=A0ABW9KK75_9BACT|nr:TonB-dependent receptor [Terriglobus aquaticus]